MSNTIKKLFGAFGLEVRLQRNVARARQAEKDGAVLDRWRPLTHYRPRTILDIGANAGQFARLARAICPDAHIVCFEPLQDCFAELQAALARDLQVTARPWALGSENGEAQIHRSEFSPSSSLLPMGDLHRREFPHTVATHEETIQVRRLDDIAGELNLRGPMVAKIDVQGFECEVLSGGPQTLRQCTALIVELSCHALYEGQPLFDDVYTRLKDLGFEYRGNLDQLRSPADGRILQCDGLFENVRPIPASNGDAMPESRTVSAAT